MSDMVIINDQNFEQEVIESEIPVLVDFWAEWCSPCKLLSPILEEISNEYNGKLKIGKGNVEELSIYTSKFKVSALPTILLFNKGKVVKRKVGLLQKKEIQKDIERVINELSLLL